MNRFLIVIAALSIMPGCASRAQDPPPPALAVGLDKLGGAGQSVLTQLGQAVQADSFPNTTSVLLVQNDTLVYEGYFGYGDRRLLNDTRSATKTLTALVVGIAIEAGYLRREDRVFDILADLAPFAHDSDLKRSITVSDLLTMSSALSCNDDDATSPGNEENMYPLKDWSRWAVDIPVKEGYQRNADGRGPFAYCTAGSFLLGQVLERTTGRSVDAYFREVLFDPLGIQTWDWSRSPTGEFMTGGGLRLQARDLAKIGLAVLNEGEWQGRHVFPASWLQEGTTAQVRANEEQTYGYQMWRRTWRSDSCGATEAAYMSGNGGNAIVILPEFDAVIVVTRQHYGRRGMHQQTIRIIENYVMEAMNCSG